MEIISKRGIVMRGKLKKKICMIMISVLCMFSICSMNTEYVVAANVLSKNQKQSFTQVLEEINKNLIVSPLFY